MGDVLVELEFDWTVSNPSPGVLENDDDSMCTRGKNVVIFDSMGGPADSPRAAG